MSSSSIFPRQLLIFALVLPLAALLGYLLATPEDFLSAATVALVGGVLLIPVFLGWHYHMLILSWNVSLIAFFLPGQPPMWVVFAALSLFIAVLDRLLNKREIGTHVPSLVWPLIFLTIVILVTMQFRGGIGLRTMGGGTYGGKRYVLLLVSILGFFSISARRVSPSQAPLFLGLFFLSALTVMMSNLIYKLGPAFWFLFQLFPVDGAVQQATAEYSIGTSVVRISGLAISGIAVCCFMLARYGVAGITHPSKLWRLGLFTAITFITLLGGFRSSLLMLLILCAFMFLLEGLHRTRLFAAVVIFAIVFSALLLPFSSKLPISVQRSLAILPLDLDERARADARGTTEWRLKMWKILLPEVPKYFWLGKGFSINPTDIYLAAEAARSGLTSDIDVTILSGSYHSGPLTVIVFFGIFGTIGFLWFAIAGVVYLVKCYRYGPLELRLINTFILAYFLMRLVYFLIFYGQFADDLFVFTGILGLGVAINGNGRVKREEQLTVLPVAETRSLSALPAR